MSKVSWFTLLLAVLVARYTAALPVAASQVDTLAPRASSACKSLAQRVNWNTLTTAQKNAYFDAVKCLKTKPSQTGFEASKNLFDDFPSIHIQQNHHIHSVAAFLPWHRRFVQARERALQSCGYSGPTPYWDWTKAADTGNPQVDPIFSVQDGFGGNGDPDNQQAVTQGPFANFELNIQTSGTTDDILNEPHLLRRNFEDNPYLFDNFNSTAVAKAQVISAFNNYRYYVEGVPHGAVHQYIAGDMAPASSPNEPLFFLHHAAIDRLWALWQDMDPSKRLTDYAGNLPGASSRDGPFDATIDDMLPSFGGLIDQVPVRNVMNTRAGDLCYEYV
ncbi:uncharacterized protein SPSC_03740 [Sporisorium scitamineum]|uniref:Tyrosinase copper-binding domain-containing protein n=1 Tax=Sporisorium scitamineum TaxID=49012 RepID=A0A0F7S7B3_9BASI|nr:uncharacterized protein SPSC_03740 [Sporisorium scitamineum]CDW97164.1 hypothetical protein [Sporisorium scitamineum]